MVNEAKLLNQKARGEHAKRAMENPALKEALEKIEERIDQGFREPDPEVRNNAYLMFRLFQNFKEQLQQMVITGNAAEKDLLKLEK